MESVFACCKCRDRMWLFLQKGTVTVDQCNNVFISWFTLYCSMDGTHQHTLIISYFKFLIIVSIEKIYENEHNREKKYPLFRQKFTFSTGTYNNWYIGVIIKERLTDSFFFFFFFFFFYLHWSKRKWRACLSLLCLLALAQLLLIFLSIVSPTSLVLFVVASQLIHLLCHLLCFFVSLSPFSLSFPFSLLTG